MREHALVGRQLLVDPGDVRGRALLQVPVGHNARGVPFAMVVGALHGTGAVKCRAAEVQGRRWSGATIGAVQPLVAGAELRAGSSVVANAIGGVVERGRCGNEVVANARIAAHKPARGERWRPRRRRGRRRWRRG